MTAVPGPVAGSGTPVPRGCVACPLTAVTCLNGADLCASCADLVDQMGGGEEGLMELMRVGPQAASRRPGADL